MINIGSIAAGITSGFIGGVVTVELRARRERRLEEMRWYNRTEQLASRILQCYQDEYDDSEKSIHSINTCKKISTQLNRHMMDAPICISNRLSECSENLLFQCHCVQQLDTRMVTQDPSKVEDPMEEAFEYAKKLKEKANDEKTTVNWI